MKELGNNIIRKSLIVFIMFFALTSLNTVFAKGIQDEGNEPVIQEQKILLWTEPSVRPVWLDNVPQSATEFYFVGTSRSNATAADARDAARENARNQVLDYYGQFIERQARESASISGVTTDTLAAFIVREEEIRSYAENIISQVATENYYTEAYLNSDNQEEYIVYVLCQINRQKAEDEINNFALNISRRYTAMLTQGSTLKGTLESYITVLRALEQNTLHRMIAYHDTASGRVGLYGFVLSNINELINSVSFTSLQNRVVQRTDDLNVIVRFQSALIPNIGSFKCKVTIYGSGFDPLYVFCSIENDNSFLITIYTSSLNPGRYTVQLELLLDEITGNIAKNITSGFSFEVTPLNVLLDSPEAIEAGIKRVIDTLALNLQPQTETVIGLFTMIDTDIPSELSVFLSEKAAHYAINNQERKYRIMENETEQTAVLSGFFRKINDRVNVTFELKNHDRERVGSQIFSLSVDVLENIIGIAIEPENSQEMAKLQEVIDQINEIVNPNENNQKINIEAHFNSNTRTYKHRDELKLTVTADTDCYFKIIHIDVNNEIKMIFPTRNDSNNFLRANVSRNIFGNQNNRYIFTDPYGAETLVIVASHTQFPNIEQEYNKPWKKPATEEAIREAIAGAGEARYNITILEPHEENSYTKPENMTELFQSIRDDVVRQNGYLEGNENSAFYIINNIRGSYRVINNSNTIHFTTYYLDAYTAESYRGTRTRGRHFNFSFEKPNDIRGAVQAVRQTITENGGTFTGNEQEGNFKAKGIAGQYNVADVVNVIILEKPFVIPNSLIVNEIKNYFGVR